MGRYNTSAEAVRYTLVEGPRFGTISGTAPRLRYTPAPGFVGLERMRYTVGNGTSTSRPSDITIEVQPATNDTTRPTVEWTSPSAGDTVAVPTASTFRDDQGPLYGPMVVIQFSEGMKDTTLTAANVRMVDSNNHTVPLRLAYDASTNQAMLLAREPLKAGVTYTMTLGTGIADMRGNTMMKPYSWNFRTGGTSAPDYRVYIPMVRR